MAFWSKKKPEAHHNAPAHWPAVTLEQFDNPGVNLIMIAGALAEKITPPDSLMELMVSFVYDDGILDVPIVITEGDKKTGIFVYGNNDKDAAAKYSAVLSLLKTRENMGAVYYGPESLAPATGGKVLKTIDTPMFSRQTEPRANARYSLWWATPEDPTFSASPDRPLLDKWFEQVNGYGYLLFSSFVRELKLVEDKDQQPVYGLPAQPLLLQLLGPGNTQVMLHASEEAGLFLAFDEETTTVKRRHAYLKLLADFLDGYRQAIAGHKLPPRAGELGKDTWPQVRDAALAKEQAGGEAIQIYGINVTDGRVARDPGASSSADRAAMPTLPSDDALGFGIDLAERIGARLKSKTVEASTTEKLAGPNAFPVIAARVAGKIYERSLPYEEPDVAVSAAARALDEWPTADVVAVLVDAAIRENGQRTDILGVTVQQTGASSAAAVMQRYRPAADGTIELFGRPSVMPREAFLNAPTPPMPNAPPDASFMSLVADVATRVGQRESYGSAHTDPHEPWTTPYALIPNAKGEIVQTVFAMQGPLTAASSCVHILTKDEFVAAPWVAYVIDDLITVDGVPDRRTRICLSRRGDGATALIDCPYEGIETDRGFRWKGEPRFVRWAGAFM